MLRTFKPFWKTCEFVSSAIFICGWPQLFHVNDELLCKVYTAVVCAYIIARALFKKNRADTILNGQRTSEFCVYVFWMGCLLFAAWKHFVELDLVFILAAITQACFVLARGYTKGHSSVKATVVSL